jgi:hypothetical protein
VSSLGYVIKGDKTAVVISQASDLLSGKMKIGDSVDLIDGLIESKQHFLDFQGEASREYLLAKELLNVLRMISRSIRLQKESEKLTLHDWVNKFPIRAQYVNKIEALVS